MKLNYDYMGRSFTLELTPGGKLRQVILGDKTVSVELVRVEGSRLDLLIDGQPCSAYVTKDGAKRWVTVNGRTLVLTNSGQSPKSGAHSAQPAGLLTAQMAGLVRAVLVAEGETVKKGQTLAVIEAMKMENKLSAPFDGLVKMMKLVVGQTVEREQVLIEITPSDEKSRELPIS